MMNVTATCVFVCINAFAGVTIFMYLFVSDNQITFPGFFTLCRCVFACVCAWKASLQ